MDALEHFCTFSLGRVSTGELKVLLSTILLSISYLRKNDIVSNDAGHWTASLLEMPLCHRGFSHILLVRLNNLVSS